MILDYLNGKHNKTPIWFMRQAGRYLPEYRSLRSKHDSFLSLCYNPQVASEISLQPIKRFPFDGIILFSDILVVPDAMGIKVDFIENAGPVLEPINLDKKNNFNSTEKFLDKLSPVFQTIDLLRQHKKKKTLIGFCGSPFTVLTYMIEGKTSKDHFSTKVAMRKKKRQIDHLLNKLIEYSIAYLERQIESGADIIQIFESWAGVPNEEQYENVIVKPNKTIVKTIKKKYPEKKIICFTKGNQKHLLSFLNEVPCDVISTQAIEDQRIIDFCKKNKVAVQGNLDPIDLYVGGKDLEKKVKGIMEQFKGIKHIFNLSHGIYPKTPLKNVYKTIELVRNANVT